MDLSALQSIMQWRAQVGVARVLNEAWTVVRRPFTAQRGDTPPERMPRQ